MNSQWSPHGAEQKPRFRCLPETKAASPSPRLGQPRSRAPASPKGGSATRLFVKGNAQGAIGAPRWCRETPRSIIGALPEISLKGCGREHRRSFAPTFSARLLPGIPSLLRKTRLRGHFALMVVANASFAVRQREFCANGFPQDVAFLCFPSSTTHRFEGRKQPDR